MVTKQRPITRQDAFVIAAGLLALLAIYPFSDRLFDVAAELAFVIGALNVLEMARNLRSFVRDDYPLFLALSIAAVAALQLAHAATYPGLHLLAGGDDNLAELLQLAAGLLLAAGMLAAPFMAGRRIRASPLVGGYALLVGAILAAVFSGRVPPALGASGEPTTLATMVDIVVALALLLAAGLTHRRRGIEPRLALAVELALGVAALGWLLRVVVTRDDFTHLMGVLFVALLYVAVTKNGLARPTALLVADLKEHGEREARKGARTLVHLRDSQERYRTVFEQSPAGLLLFDQHLVVTRCNARLCELLKSSEGAIVGSDLHELPDAQLVAQISGALEGRVGVFEGRLRNTYNSDEELFISARAAPLVSASDESTGGIVIVVDLTESKRAEELIERLAFHDILTGLANRTLLRDRLRVALLVAARNATQPAVLFLDIDRFADINHLVGHAAADRVLQEVAARLQSVVREIDTVARWGADEFIVLLSEANGAEGATRLVEGLARALSAPLPMNGHGIALTASIGVALPPNDGADAETLLEHAAIAGGRAKASGGDSYRFYDAAAGREVMERVALEGELRSALHQLEFVLHYQPQVDLNSTHVVGVEALVRWQHPQRGLLAPIAFLPVMEAMGIMEELTAWVVVEACRQAAAWQRAGSPLRMAVNLSARDFRGGRVVGVVDAALSQSGLAPQWLEVELTETAIVDDTKATARQLEELRAHGVSVALDDFGTGYSSLSHLRTLPISRVKIDRSFVSHAAGNDSDAAIVGAMIALIHSLGLEAIAEGIETEEDLAFLRRHDCDLGQGYFFSRPLPAEECSLILGLPVRSDPLARSSTGMPVRASS
jgi:diguanylate cyclase (GGDEF)-like protein/PAS domain S-box-containing protein